MELADADVGHTELQWGRACEGAETQPWREPFRLCSRFNGAAPVRARRRVAAYPLLHRWQGFNGAAPVRARRRTSSLAQNFAK